MLETQFSLITFPPSFSSHSLADIRTGKISLTQMFVFGIYVELFSKVILLSFQKLTENKEFRIELEILTVDDLPIKIPIY